MNNLHCYYCNSIISKFDQLQFKPIVITLLIKLMSFLLSCKIIFKLFLININNNIRCLG